ncbi:DUF2637 domain-containing protein [Virgisporangium aurantiacum]|uniref:DUF2637 domain-containing protein n=1 Tax=Virgisporangium aurantiacum TaxID=175570 RepID=A0A8J3YZY1_9ACTN|nr:DUF2637 domain-containing protein [Virgisporangium aurantiacum]GIJ52800.1 hypothetical protein Vau01_003160 [Virgisporangium aurantiacum]
MSLRQLRRVRWAVRAVLTLGVAASVAANILHANQNPIAQAIAAWPPLALLLTVELISRVPVYRRSLAAVRLGATATIAGIAAWVSYWHMAGVAARYGETGAAPYLLPLSVDGLVVVASVSLVELAGRLRAMQEKDNMGRVAPVPEATPLPGNGVTTITSAMAEVPTSGGSELVETKPLLQPEPGSPVLSENLRENLREHLGEHFGERLAAVRPRQRTTTSPATARATASARVPTGARIPAQAAPARRGRPVEETRRLAAELAARQPDATTDDLAKQLGISTQRLRRVLSA